MPQQAAQTFQGRPAHWIVRMNHRVRSGTFVIVFAMIGAHMADGGYGAWAWALLAVQFLIYPHVIYWAACRARDPMRAEMRSLLLDPLLMGMWIAALGFPLWISYSIVIGTLISISVYRCARGMAAALAAQIAGGLLVWAVHGWHFAPHTGWPATALSIFALTLYLLAVAKSFQTRSLKLHAAREQLRQNEQALQQRLQEIDALQARLRDQATRDPLTGLYNRRYFDDTLARELARCQRDDLPLSLILIDLDHFKRINDTYGHAGGDEVLRKTAQLLQEKSREADVVCRYGGEEFLLLLPNMSLATARDRAELYRATLESTPILFGERGIPVTLSVGVATYPDHAPSAEQLIGCADHALYQAKTGGRNLVVAYEAPTA